MFGIKASLIDKIKQAITGKELAAADGIITSKCFGCSTQCVSSCYGGCKGSCAGGCGGTCSGRTR